MNERIRELAKQAVSGIQADFYIPDVFKEKFAELIVKECLGFCQSEMDCREIKKHFGVEE